MSYKTFEGGIHPPDAKHYSKNSPIQQMPLPPRAVIFLSQHIGSPSKPIVEVGDLVKTGQKIAETTGFVSLNQHASISGKVVNIGLYPSPSGAMVNAIEIESDGKDEWIALTDEEDYQDMSIETMRLRVADAGVCGMGGAGFPTVVKMTPPPDKDIDTLVINGVECEPYLTADCRIMVERTADIINGLKLALKILGAKRGIIGIEANKPKSIKIMKNLTRKDPQIKVVPLQLKYPQGAEKQLIYATTQRKVPNKGGLPSAVGCAVDNVATLIAIYEAVRYKKPLVERIITISGKIVNKPSNLLVRVGTKFSDIVDFCQGVKKPIGKVISGGPMMGFALDTLEVYSTKTSSGIILLDEKEAHQDAEHTCIRCGRCVDSCPMRIMPSFIASAMKYGDVSAAERAGAMDCMKCGCCAYVCPAHIKLVQWCELGKQRILELRSKGA